LEQRLMWYVALKTISDPSRHSTEKPR
jgi:hypothetical protein